MLLRTKGVFLIRLNSVNALKNSFQGNTVTIITLTIVPAMRAVDLEGKLVADPDYKNLHNSDTE